MNLRSVISRRIAREVHASSRVGPPLLQRKCSCGASRISADECEACQSKRLQRRAAGPGPAPVPSIVREELRSAGQPLNNAVRTYFEPIFGHDFSHVRVHTTEHAAKSARSVNALAYTVGDHLVFDSGQYQPASRTGRRLIAHELTHVLQQGGGQPSLHKLSVGEPEDAFEQQAERVAESLATDSPAHQPSSSLPRVTPLAVPGNAAVIQRQVPTGISLKDIKSFGHAELADVEDKKKFGTYIGAVALMQLTPPGDYTAGQQKGDCTKEFITEIANTCPTPEKPFCQGDRCFEVGNTKAVGDALTHKNFSGGPDSFVDFHRDRQQASFLAGSGKKQCSVVCHQVYKYRAEPDRKYHELGAFYIIRNFKAGQFTPPGSQTPTDITSGDIQKVSAPTTAPSKEEFSKKVAPGLVKSGALIDAPPVSSTPSSPTQSADEKK
jgi:hypothetical protein